MKGDIVVLDFPFTDLSRRKRRPALVVYDSSGADVILAPITSVAHGDPEITIDETDIEEGQLIKRSYLRPQILFTAHKDIVLYTAGKLRKEVMTNVIDKIVELLRTDR